MSETYDMTPCPNCAAYRQVVESVIKKLEVVETMTIIQPNIYDKAMETLSDLRKLRERNEEN